ncbi:hypothetical protein Tco_0534602 [Tanacetum coccineum]
MMASLSEDINSAGSDTRPLMLDRETLADGDKGSKRDRVFKDLTLKEKDRYKADIRATNILLQESELTKDDHESQLYDVFEHFCQNKGETIHEYYVRFTKLINDMKNIKMTMPKMQLNSKFMNNILPKSGRFVTAVKLNRGLKSSNYDQLYAYLKHHEAHANENKMMLERYTQDVIDPLAFVSNVSLPQYPTQSSTVPPSAYVPLLPYSPNPTKHTFLKLTINSELHLTQGTKPQFKMTGLLFRMFRVDRTEFRRTIQGEQLQLEMGEAHSKTMHSPKATTYFGLLQGQDAADASLGEWNVQDLALNVDQVFQADQCDAFNSDVDEAPTKQTIFMENRSSVDPIYDESSPSYDSDILSEVQDHDNYLDSAGEYHEVHEMQNDVQQNYIVDSDAKYMSDSNIILYEKYVKNDVEQVVQRNVSSVPNDALMMIINDMHEQAAQCISMNEQNKVVNESLTAELTRYKEQVEIYEKRASQDQSCPCVVHDSEDTIELAEINRKRMLEKMKSPLWDKNKIKIAPSDFSKENYLATFIPQRQLSAEQIVWSSVLKQISEMTVVMNSMNTVSRFSEMHDAYTVEQARNVELEAGISKLKHKIKKDDHNRFGNNKSHTSQDAPEFDSFFKINKLKEQLQRKDNTIRKLKLQISHMNERRSKADRILDFKALDSQNIELTENVTALQEQNERLRTENKKVKQHYKELYDSIKITHAKTIKKTSSLLTENEKLKAQLKGKMNCVTMNTVKPKVLALGMYAIDVEPILPHNRNNREVHLDYLKHLKESVETLREIVGRGVNSSTEASGSKPKCNTKNNWILPAKSDNKKKVEDHPRNNKSNLKQENRVDSIISYKRTVINSNSKSVCKISNNCLIFANHDKCVVKYLKTIQHVKNGLSKVKQVWKATGKLFANVGYQWKATGKKFTLGEQCPLTSDNIKYLILFSKMKLYNKKHGIWTQKRAILDFQDITA